MAIQLVKSLSSQKMAKIDAAASSRQTCKVSVSPLPRLRSPPGSLSTTSTSYFSVPQEAARCVTGLVIAASIIIHPNLALADPVEQTFVNTCGGCHAGGGNIVRREATLKLEDLTKYGVDSVDELYNVIYSGRGSMPGYGEGCTPKGACTFGRRLTETDVRELAEYVLKQAKAGWE